MFFDIFDMYVDGICDKCCAGSDLCGPLTSDCPFCSEFEVLKELCIPADNQAQYPADAASNYNPEAERDFYEMDDWRR